MLKDPRIPNCPARNPNHVYPCLLQHPHRIFGREYIAAPQDRLLRIPRFELFKKRPPRPPIIFLFDRSRMNADGAEAQRPGLFDDLIKPILRLRRFLILGY